MTDKTDNIDWPTPPKLEKNDPQKVPKEALFQAKLDVEKQKHQAGINTEAARVLAETESEKARVLADVEREKADWANEYTQAQAFYTAYIDVAKDQISRMAAKAEFVQKAAGAIGGAYTAILAFTFAVGQEGVDRLPPRGIIPAVFLGLSIVLATGYLAYETKPGTTQEPISGGGTFAMRQRERRNTFITWASRSGFRRLYLLQASIFALGFGVAFLPAPYIRAELLQLGITSGDRSWSMSGNTLIWTLTVIFVILTFVLPALINWLRRKRSSNQ